MSQIKNHLYAYTHLLKSLFTLFRMMAFEKFTALFFFFYILFVLSLAFILSVIHWGVAAVVLVVGLLLFTKSLQSFQFLKCRLIFKGDRVEYADPSVTEGLGIFKTAKVLLKMRPAEVEKTALISKELMEDNRTFYLVEGKKGPTVIAYDWIVSLSPELLD